MNFELTENRPNDSGNLPSRSGNHPCNLGGFPSRSGNFYGCFIGPPRLSAIRRHKKTAPKKVRIQWNSRTKNSYFNIFIWVYRVSIFGYHGSSHCSSRTGAVLHELSPDFIGLITKSFIQPTAQFFLKSGHLLINRAIHGHHMLVS